MGQQQLLLILVAIILVAAALFVSLDLFDTQAEQSNRDAVQVDLNRLAGFAQLYYSKLTEQAGGNRSFVGYSIPSEMDTNSNGVYTIVYAREDRILFQGIGSDINETDKVTYQILVTPTGSTMHQVK